MSDDGEFTRGISDDLAKDNAIPGYIDPLDLPRTGVGPVLAVKRFYRLYATFTGRASRSEYWWVVAFLAVTLGVLAIAGHTLGVVTGRDVNGEMQPGVGAAPVYFAMGLLAVLSIIPAIALGIRRLHDANLPGPLYLIALVPSVGSFALLVLSALPSRPDGARFDHYRPVYPSTLQRNPHARDNEAYPPSEYAAQQHAMPFYTPGPPL